MARMFGLIGNRPDLAGRVLRANARWLRTEVGGGPVGWGVGFFQAGEILLRRRPSDDRGVIDLTETAGEVRGDVLIGHVRQPSVGALRTENTQPFRYRAWLYAQTGTVFGFERLAERLSAAQPDFLRRNVRGETDAEATFYLFLSFLHDAGQLESQRAAPERVREALRATLALVDRLSAEEGHPENDGDLLLSNGEELFAVHRTGSMALRVLRGRNDLEELLGDDRPEARVANVDQARYALVASGLSEVPFGWTALERRVIVTATRDDPPAIETL